ncbi:hypothetical protein Y032_0086g2001 [Ancylostoma ceylanicum]|uniref:Uncharacterized protein n=1 Tax=Ancylostoma ceylanicum TaxID=53326 RepID=A0A016TQS2_9BILA|nr:hypothetical protein Y032_0086g2001 [Ancylostoma ceylanicum]
MSFLVEISFSSNEFIIIHMFSIKYVFQNIKGSSLQKDKDYSVTLVKGRKLEQQLREGWKQLRETPGFYIECITLFII